MAIETPTAQVRRQVCADCFQYGIRPSGYSANGLQAAARPGGGGFLQTYVIRSSHMILGVLWGTVHVMDEVKVRTVEKAGRNHPRICVSNCVLCAAGADGSVVHSPIYVRETSLQQELG